MIEVPLPTRRDTRRLGRALAGVLAGGDLVLLDGPLGVGKTFLVRAICRSLGLPPGHRVTSPTFVLVNEHPTRPPVAHADLYRLQTAAEVRGLGLDALRDEGRLLLVEWGGGHAAELGGDALLVQLAAEPRCATLTATGPTAAARLTALSEALRPAPLAGAPV